MMSFSSAYTRIAETRPPSWPTSASTGSVARARTMSLKMPDGSSAVRARPNMNSSISGSQARKRGQARVHDVQPFSPWLQLLGAPQPSSSWNGL